MRMCRISVCLSLLAIPLSLSASPRSGTETDRIREELGQLKRQSAETSRRIAFLQAKLKPHDDNHGAGPIKSPAADEVGRRVGLDGFCPVVLVQQRNWQPGDPRYQSVYEDCVYRFAGPAQKKEFEKNPSRYSPVISGNDPVLWIDQQQRVAGRREHGVFYLDRIFLFSSEENLERFSRDPDQYVVRVFAPKSTQESVTSSDAKVTNGAGRPRLARRARARNRVRSRKRR